MATQSKVVKKRLVELKQVIVDAEDEIKKLERGMDWKEACRYMYETAKAGKHMQVEDTKTESRFHSYEGIGILYTKHAIENSDAKYKEA